MLKHRWVLSVIGCGLLLALGACPRGNVSCPAYTMEMVGLDTVDQWASALNYYGEVVGTARHAESGLPYPALWGAGQVSEIDYIYGCASPIPTTISDNGAIAGLALDCNNVDVGGTYSTVVRWSYGDTERITSFSPPFTVSAVNNNLTIVGSTGSNSLVLFRDQNSFTGVLSQFGASARAYDVNNREVIVGTDTAEDGLQSAVMWDLYGERLLEGFGGDAGAYALNEWSVVVGEATVTTGAAAGQSHACVWTAPWTDPQPQDLGTVPGGDSSMARDVNIKGDIVGESTTGDGKTVAVLWRQRLCRRGYEPVVLEEQVGAAAGWSFDRGLDINDRGQIVVHATRGTESAHFLLTPKGPRLPVL